jgi:hypothetical protein
MAVLAYRSVERGIKAEPAAHVDDIFLGHAEPPGDDLDLIGRNSPSSRAQILFLANQALASPEGRPSRRRLSLSAAESAVDQHADCNTCQRGGNSHRDSLRYGACDAASTDPRPPEAERDQ